MSDGDTYCNWLTRYSYQRIDAGTGRHGYNKTSRDHGNYTSVEITQITKKGPGDLRRLAVTQTQWKTIS